jgi:hypothetical protein
VIYKILSLHKSGSTLQESLFKHLAHLTGMQYYKSYEINNEKEDRNIPDNSIVTYRSIFATDNCIIIPRHPLNRLISQYYSVGWTHGTTFPWITDEKEKQARINTFLSRRDEIQTMSLDEYVLRNIEDRKKEYDYLLKTKELIIPYEFMMSYPVDFFDVICKKFNAPSLSNDMYKHFSRSFEYDKDITKKILKSKDKKLRHYERKKRTLDNNECWSKLKKDTLKECYSSSMKDVLYFYEKLVDYHFINNVHRSTKMNCLNSKE